MPLIKKITRIGNSSGLILPRVVLDQLDWNSEEELELVVEGHNLVIKPHKYASEEKFTAAAGKVLSGRGRLMDRLAKQ